MVGDLTASASSASAGPAEPPTPVEDMDLRVQEAHTAIGEGFHQELESLQIPAPSDQVAYAMGAASEGLDRPEYDDDGARILLGRWPLGLPMPWLGRA